MSRRHFLGATLGAGAGILAAATLGELSGCAHAPPPPARRAGGRRVFADLHLHASLYHWLAHSPMIVRRPAMLKALQAEYGRGRFTWDGLHRQGVDLVCAAHLNPFDEWLTMPTDPNPEAPANTLRMLRLFEEELAGSVSDSARLVRNARELDRCLAVRPGDPGYRIAVVHTLEGGHVLGQNLAALEEFARLGVASITVAHFFDNGLATAGNAFPFFPDAGSIPPKEGLSALGRDAVLEMNRLGIIVDVSHMTSTAIADVLALSGKPVVASHAASRTLGDHPCSIYDEHAQEIARRGGLIGIILYPHALSNYAERATSVKFGAMRDVIGSIRHLAKVCRTHEHLAFGSDYGSVTTGPKEMPSLDRLDVLRAHLADEFRDEDVVEAVMAGNAIEFLRSNWGTGVSSP